MTDGILSKLRITEDPPPDARDLVRIHNAVVDMALAALRHPTDEQRALMGKALWDAGPCRPGDPKWEDLDLGLRRIYEKEACAVLAAAAGGDDE